MAQGDQLYELVVQCLEDSQEYFPDAQHDLAMWVLCLCGEAGELANVVKKIARGSLDWDDPKTQLQLRMELTDVFIYLLNIAGFLGVDLAEAFKVKRDFNHKRFLTKTSEVNDG
jgi:NTP pyrophosphatase (non-canonical NTP hydrolase)